MKLTELATPKKSRQTARVFESYFGTRMPVHKLTLKEAQAMLRRVRGVIAEHQRSTTRHTSEQNPAYLKLVMMEQGLTSRISEAEATPANPQQQAALQTAQVAQRKREMQDEIKANQDQIRSLQAKNSELQRMMNSPVGESKIARRLREASEVQQAQVVLASKDMVDQVQKMIEDASAMQFKDLPALVDQIRNEVGYDQATQFNADATAALSGLVQNLQGSKQQLEGALGVVTGQAPQVPGQDLGAAPALDAGADLGAELPPEGEEELDVDADLDIDAEEEPSSLETSLGRAKR